LTLDSWVQKATRDAILDALSRTNGNRTRAALLLGISRRTMQAKLLELGIIPPHGG
jgi:two-component system response regulator PilR (NtrC family)